MEGRTIATYTLLDNDSQSKLVRDDFAKNSNLKEYKITITIASLINDTEEFNKKEVVNRNQVTNHNAGTT